MGDKKKKAIGIFKAIGAFFTFKKVKETMKDLQDYNKSIDAMASVVPHNEVFIKTQPVKKTAEKGYANKITIENPDIILDAIEANTNSPIDSDTNHNQSVKSQTNSNIDTLMKKFKNLTKNEIEIIQQTYIKYNIKDPKSIEYFAIALDNIKPEFTVENWEKAFKKFQETGNCTSVYKMLENQQKTQSHLLLKELDEHEQNALVWKFTTGNIELNDSYLEAIKFHKPNHPKMQTKCLG